MDDAIPIGVPGTLRSKLNLEYADTDSIKGVLVDLNHDGVKDYVIQSAPTLCGNGGCIYALFRRLDGQRAGPSIRQPALVLEEEAHGYPLIETYSHMSAESGNYTTYMFNGTAYVVTSTRLVEGASLDTLFATLRRIPLWKPRP